MKNSGNRRNFIRILTMAIPASLFTRKLSSATPGLSPVKKIDGSFRHHVFFWLKNPDNEEERKVFLDNLTSFLEKVDVILSVHVGEPAETQREIVDNSYHYDLLVTFKDKKDQDIYQEHPAHEKFVDDTSRLWTKVLVYDSLSVWPI
ncbi:MAG: Dabb family protein [bacterium]